MSSPFIAAPRPESAASVPALAPLTRYLSDPQVTDLFVNGQAGLFVDSGHGAIRVPDWRASEREVRQLAASLIEAGNRHVDDAHPCVDVRLPGGVRVHVVLAPIASSGTAISVRVSRPDVTSFDDLGACGSMDGPTADFLRAAIARRANFLISGAAGVGKTTMLAALLALAAPQERIVTIEDVAELRIDHPHHVALEARQANLEGAGAVGLDRLVREALRMKPDRLVVGECRGGEVRELLTALNTGHDGGAGTVHANSLTDVATRLEALGALAGLDDLALARQVRSAMEFVVHLERASDGSRRIAAIGTFADTDGRLQVVPEQIATAPSRRRARRRSTEPVAGSEGDRELHGTAAIHGSNLIDPGATGKTVPLPPSSPEASDPNLAATLSPHPDTARVPTGAGNAEFGLARTRFVPRPRHGERTHAAA